MMSNRSARIINWAIIIGLIGFGLMMSETFAKTAPKNIGDLAVNLTEEFPSFGHLILALCYIAGLGFFMASIAKFKQYKENSTQIPVETPFALLGVSVLLMFIPGLTKPAGYSIFGTDANLDDKAAWFTGARIKNFVEPKK